MLCLDVLWAVLPVCRLVSSCMIFSLSGISLMLSGIFQ